MANNYFKGQRVFKKVFAKCEICNVALGIPVSREVYDNPERPLLICDTCDLARNFDDVESEPFYNEFFD